MKKHIIFDLDGTLVDSAPGVIEGLRGAFLSSGYAPRINITNKIIGPPLLDMLSVISGTDDRDILNDLSEQFVRYYDGHGFQCSNEYKGISELLKYLSGSGFTLYIATNKRLIPSGRIIAYFGWSDYFECIYAIDSFDNIFSNKSEIICQIVKDFNIPVTDCFYIGDRDDDLQAAVDNGVSFVGVSWGYGEDKIFNGYGCVAESIGELQDIIETGCINVSS